jgi:phage regulator Rha-like protein
VSDLVKVAAIVAVHHGKPFTNTIAIAEGVGIDHASVIKLVRKYKTDFEEFGHLGFEIHVVNRVQGGGTNAEIAELNEDQATYLMTLFRNTPIVRKFKIKLVKAFRKALNELERLRKQCELPEWQQARIRQKAAQQLTNAYVQHAREEQGKATWAHQYINEELLLNELVTGERRSTNRDEWPREACDFALEASKRNAGLALRGLSNKERRKALLPWAEDARHWQQKLLEGPT